MTMESEWEPYIPPFFFSLQTLNHLRYYTLFSSNLSFCTFHLQL